MIKQFITVIGLSFSVGAMAQPNDFQQCIQGLQQTARQQQVPERVVDEVLGKLQQQTRVIELDRSQPEFTQTFADYFNKRVTEQRISKARQLFAEKREFLDQLTQQYGVPGQYLIAFWGLETNFGSYLGKMPTLDVLATLACDQRRSEYFSSELITALKLLEREQLSPQQMKGSWAGAMGHTQFMPSAYMQYAVDGDNDGKVDLWNSHRDALASAAHFLKNLGWQTTERWGREVVLPKDFPYADTGLKYKQPLSVWRELGVARSDGALLPALDMQGAILVPMGHTGPAFIAYSNFSVIMRWNYSESYALAVGHLADRITGGTGLKQAFATDTPRLTPRLVIDMQQRLNQAGFDAGKADGIIGSGTRAALRNYQSQQGMIADGYPSFSTLAALGVSNKPADKSSDE